MTPIAWKEREKLASRGSSLKLPDAVLKQILELVKSSKKGAVETEMKPFLKEIGYEGSGAPGTITYLIDKQFYTKDEDGKYTTVIPLKCGSGLNGKIIAFGRFQWETKNKGK